MKFTAGKMIIVGGDSINKVEVQVHFAEENKMKFIQSGDVMVYLDSENLTVAELERKAIRAAKDFLVEIAQGIIDEPTLSERVLEAVQNAV